MDIRLAKRTDAKTLDKLYNLCRQEFDFPDKKDVSLDFIQGAISAEHTDFVVCFDNNIAIGYISYSETISTAIMGKAALIVDFYIHKDYRSRGIGSEMLSYMEDYLTNQNFTCMFLVTMPHLENTKQFYIKNGWLNEDLIFFRRKFDNNIA